MKAKLPVMYTKEYMEERIQYLDMLALMALHDEFGFGPERLKRYYRAISKMDDAYGRYRDPEHDPAWGKRDKTGAGRTDLWKLRQDLRKIGFDYDSMVDEA